MFLAVLIIALCLDTFTTSFAYGVSQTKIPIASMAIIGVICTAALTVSTVVASGVSQLIPVSVTQVICVLILFALGLVKSFESVLKRYIAKSRNRSGQLRLTLFDVHFVLTVYADNSKADIDQSKVLSPAEAVYLALALSLDGFAAGFGFGLTEVNYVWLVLLSFMSNVLAVFLGCAAGKLITKMTKFDFSWLGGVILMLLAVSKLRNY
ncbi:MAG: sporulation rane protein YtaF [Oscillospiraceae bacterium]|nr:sporulation rane protein YtaF [Oscillospiraceae bacterium]